MQQQLQVKQTPLALGILMKQDSYPTAALCLLVTNKSRLLLHPKYLLLCVWQNPTAVILGCKDKEVLLDHSVIPSWCYLLRTLSLAFDLEQPLGRLQRSAAELQLREVPQLGGVAQRGAAKGTTQTTRRKQR